MSKTQSKFGVTVNNFNSVANVEFRNLNQTIIGDAGYTKFDLDGVGGVVLNNAIAGYKIKGQYYQSYLEQCATSSIYYLFGNTKV